MRSQSSQPSGMSSSPFHPCISCNILPVTLSPPKCSVKMQTEMSFTVVLWEVVVVPQWYSCNAWWLSHSGTLALHRGSTTVVLPLWYCGRGAIPLAYYTIVVVWQILCYFWSTLWLADFILVPHHLILVLWYLLSSLHHVFQYFILVLPYANTYFHI